MEKLPVKAVDVVKHMMRPYTWRIVLFFALSLIGVISWAASPFVIRGLINDLAASGVVQKSAWIAVGLFVFLRLVDEWFWRLAEISMRKTKPPMIESVRTQLFEYALNKPYSFFVNASSGQLGYWINQTTKVLNEIVDTTIWGVWPQVAGLVLSMVFLAIANWMLALIFGLWLVLLLTYTMMRGKTYAKLVEKESEAGSKASGLVVDALSNHLSVRVFNAKQREVSLLKKRQDVIVQRWTTSWKYSTVTNAVKGHSIAIVSGVALSLILVLFEKGQITVGDVALFITYFSGAANSIWELAWQLDSYYRSFGTIDNALKGLGKGEAERTAKGVAALPNNETIELSGVAFAYPDQQKTKVLRDITLTINPGERIGLVGHSGAGKTTLVSLLLGFYEPTEGTFTIGGTNVQQMTPEQMRDLLSYVPQDTNLFNRTIAQNIAYAKTGATRKEIIQAAKDAQAYEFIKKLPEGLDTVIGERGVKLSGGQRQRIAIARALLKNAPILVLDEATSALDSVSEQAIQKAFVSAMQGRTALVVAHRLSTLRHLDKIVVFEGGTIVETGTHDELVAKNGLYADLWRRQKDGFIGE